MFLWHGDNFSLLGILFRMASIEKLYDNRKNAKNCNLKQVQDVI